MGFCWKISIPFSSSIHSQILIAQYTIIQVSIPYTHQIHLPFGAQSYIAQRFPNPWIQAKPSKKKTLSEATSIDFLLGYYLSDLIAILSLKYRLPTRKRDCTNNTNSALGSPPFLRHVDDPDFCVALIPKVLSMLSSPLLYKRDQAVLANLEIRQVSWGEGSVLHVKVKTKTICRQSYLFYGG